MTIIVTEGGWKYTGEIVATHMSLFGQLQWVKISTKNGFVRINAKYIVSILTK